MSERYRRFALNEAAKHSEIYADWALHIADDPQICSLIAGLPGDKRQPNLVFACARLAGAQPGPYANLRSVLMEQWDAVTGQIAVRSTQTNEPARDAILLPLWAQLPEPLFLIELGAAAGLGLHPQAWRYRYEWRAGGPAPRPGVLDHQSRYAADPAPRTTVVIEGAQGTGGDLPEAKPYPAGEFSVQVRPATVGRFTAPDHLPRIAGRVGVDRAPLDPRDADAQTWLRTLVWPEQNERLVTLEAALRVASADPVPVLSGDLTDPAVLTDLLDMAPAGSTPVIWHSAVLAYLPEPERVLLEERLRVLVRSGRAHWISYEGQQIVPGIWTRVLSRPPWRPALRRGAFVVSLDGEPCYQADGHATWIR